MPAGNDVAESPRDRFRFKLNISKHSDCLSVLPPSNNTPSQDNSAPTTTPPLNRRLFSGTSVGYEPVSGGLGPIWAYGYASSITF